jgi:hypothetical protein
MQDPEYRREYEALEEEFSLHAERIEQQTIPPLTKPT